MTAGALLDVPVYALQREIEAEGAAERENMAAAAATAAAARDGGLGAGAGRRKEGKGKKAKDARLWCDKYRPRLYHELGGVESTNRDVLAWVKQWDPCVFGTKRPAPRPAASTFGAKYGKWKPGGHTFDEGGVDELGRPMRKILLLCGPPGLGKTTLAHVVARHCGYEVVEVNASDDRTASSISARVNAALTHQSISGINTRGHSDAAPAPPRPNLLVIDEIDGAAVGKGEGDLVQMLLAIADGSAKKTEGAGKKGRKGPTRPPLLRPIICICNDPFAPALRPLRAAAKVVHVRPAPLRTVAKRLAYVCEEEGLEVDSRTLLQVAEAWEGDVRGCLMGLQMARARSRTLTTEDLRKYGAGKDSERSLFGVWEDVFTVPSAKQNRSEIAGRTGLEGRAVSGAGGKGKESSELKFVSRVTRSAESNGEYDRLIQGIFENYPHMRTTDVSTEPSDSRLVRASDWLAFYDAAHGGRIGVQAEMEMLRYAPFAVAAFHGMFAVVQKPKLMYPRMDYEAYLATKISEEIVQTLASRMSPVARRPWAGTRGSRAASVELVSPLIRLLNPIMRPVPVTLLRPQEKRSLTRVVRTMSEYGLTYVQERVDHEEIKRNGLVAAAVVGSDGKYMYRLEPPVQHLATFSDVSASQTKSVLTSVYAVRQVVAQEIELERLRRLERGKIGDLAVGGGKENEGHVEKDGQVEKEGGVVGGKENGALKDKTNVEWLTRGVGDISAQAKALRKVTAAQHTGSSSPAGKIAVDFWGRPINGPVGGVEEGNEMDSGAAKADGNGREKGGAKASREAYRHWYKFHEGFSNAVRTPIKIVPGQLVQSTKSRVA
ncbi:P-loop containing nucleoside triphosphate hydrolase protein [Gonapodya prolifera JEL478]|uniref:p-loop containing nucleoside triphosphate hydrolase protein n=1 Tax=Gonapodya prolifera (strain JEL478) TaxID=1344416 RepID=A0A139AYJ1_GONPJ|nr:P-loop containing nucleoside triphosphate hydrolase protein [Gonapodya prolifera JEL478]|eukprot:KXS21818.1 P-loop containing nucleoside triphosphate hydrolase protein [Gonapodya prolifera JEL478]